FSGSSINRSTSFVTRGRPRRDAATPPMTSPSTFVEPSQSRRLASAASSGGKKALSATIGLSQAVPPIAHFGIALTKGFSPSERRNGCHQGSYLMQLNIHRSPPQLLDFGFVHFVPACLVGASFGFGEPWFHRKFLA